MSEVYDLVIIGSGPAGLAAAIYAERAKLKAVTIEKNVMSGGQVVNTYEVDNYPGLPGMNGFDLAMKFREHAEQLGAGFKEDTVQTVRTEGGLHQVVCENGTYEGKTVLIATGATHRKLGVPGEDQFSGMGVSYCATCDGAFFRNKVTAVIGGGDVAVEDAIFLARLCKKVYLIHRRDELRAAKSLQEKLFAMENVEVLWDSVVEEIKGENSVNAISVKNVKTEDRKDVAVDGVFVAVGILPNSDEFKGVVDMDPQGYIKAGEEGISSVPGIFAAGDVRTKALRQIVTAVSDGANAITSIEKYLNH
jgi:thioredoxin reductase (NADPH)